MEIQSTLNEDSIEIQSTLNGDSIDIEWRFNRDSIDTEWRLNRDSIDTEWRFNRHCSRIDLYNWPVDQPMSLIVQPPLRRSSMGWRWVPACVARGGRTKAGSPCGGAMASAPPSRHSSPPLVELASAPRSTRDRSSSPSHVDICRIQATQSTPWITSALREWLRSRASSWPPPRAMCHHLRIHSCLVVACVVWLSLLAHTQC
jgi:hypothetical protein